MNTVNYEKSDAFHNLHVTRCGTIEEDQNECSTSDFCVPDDNTDTADSDQNNTVSESDVDYDSDFYNDSDLDGYWRDRRNQPLGAVSPPLYQLPPSRSPYVYTAPIAKL